MAVSTKETLNVFVLRAATYQNVPEGNGTNSIWRGWSALYKMDEAFFLYTYIGQ